MLPDPVVLLDYFRNNTAQFLSRYFSCTGPVQMISNACTSGADAIGIAASWLHADLCDVVICGGTEEILPRIHDGFRSLMLCSPSNSCQPFDISRQGLMLGEGAGVLVLEKISSPRKSKGKFLGYGSASDAMHPTAPHPEARGLETAFASALAQAGLAASSVDFVNAHATATPHNDLAEGKWLARRLAQVPVVATKGYTGHTLGAAGALEAIFTLLSLSENVLPPSKGFSEVDPEIGFAPISARTTGEFHVAASFSLGFGGTNAVVLLGRPT
jgi:3-oxoacyl-[acyl-carrier-protein] synthase-1/3-oxoacyl-[acyl-carrier-protein] synthase II